MPNTKISQNTVVPFKTLRPIVGVDMSREDSGHSFGNPIRQGLGFISDYFPSGQWQRFRMDQGWVWRLSWSLPVKTILQGAWIIAQPAQS